MKSKTLDWTNIGRLIPKIVGLFFTETSFFFLVLTFLRLLTIVQLWWRLCTLLSSPTVCDSQFKKKCIYIFYVLTFSTALSSARQHLISGTRMGSSQSSPSDVWSLGPPPHPTPLLRPVQRRSSFQGHFAAFLYLFCFFVFHHPPHPPTLLAAIN